MMMMLRRRYHHQYALSNVTKRCFSNNSSSSSRLMDLVLIRHGESEGNVARARSISGDHSFFKGEFKTRHSALWRLTERGREQSISAGEWLKLHSGISSFDRFYVSEYLRSMESAARLNLPDAKWYAEMLLRERDWGQLDLLSEEERVTSFLSELQRKDLDPFYYAPPGGESLASVAQRADRLLASLHRECPSQKVIAVCHGEVMWALRTRLERMSTETFRDLQESGRMVDQIHYGHILHYTRRDPNNPSNITPYFSWFRSVCPWDTKRSPKGWTSISRPVYDNEMLLATAERIPRMIVSEEYMRDTYRSYEPKTKLKQKNVKPLNFKKRGVVIVNKTTRYEHEVALHKTTDDKILRKQMSMRGFVYERLLASHNAHCDAVSELTSVLKSYGIPYTVVSPSDLTLHTFDNVDGVLSTGGDGTFLTAASFLKSSEIPIIGFNTDPSRSEGKLCAASIGNKQQSLSSIFHNLFVTGTNFKMKERRRIRVVLVSHDGSRKTLERFALNEVFMSERDPSRPTFYELMVDQKPRESQRSSGIIISTGTGSSAWYYSANQLYRDEVAKVLRATNFKTNSSRISEITESLSNDVLFEDESHEVGYVVREPIINETFGEIHHRSGKARRISVRSLGWDASLHLDGLYEVPLEYGVQAVLKIGEDNSCYTIELTT